jgi:uncharacterized protein with gpF-like domain
MPSALKKSDVPFIVARISSRELIRRGQPVIETTVSTFGKRAVETIGSNVRFNEQNRRVVSFIKKWGAEHVTGMVNRTTQNRIRTVLIRGIEQGHDYAKMGKAIGRVFDVAEGSRAVMIARTEVHRASNFASLEGYQQAGVSQKEWQHTDGGENPREDHIEMDGQIVDIEDDFTSPSGNTAPYPGEFGDAGDDANCQCGVLPVVDDKRLRPSARQLVLRFFPRLRAPLEKRMRTAMKAGFKAQREAVFAEFEKRADKSTEAEAA